MSTSTEPPLKQRLSLPGTWATISLTLGMLALCQLVFSRLLPEGINREFATGTWPVAAGAAAMSLLPLYFLQRSAEPHAQALGSDSRFKPSELLLLLLPMTPVIQYVLTNQDILLLRDSALVIGLFLGFSFLLSFGQSLSIAWLYPLARIPVLLSGIALAFMLLNMPAMARDQNWHSRGDLSLQLGILVGEYAVCLLVFSINRNLLYAMIAGYFLTSTASTAMKLDLTKADFDTEPKLTKAVGNRRLPSTPPIYLLVYDAYVANATMSQYGIDNSAQEKFLEESGFKLYPGVYSVAGTTTDSMGRVLGAGDPLVSMSGKSEVHALLKEQGYHTAGVLKAGFQGPEGASYDENFDQGEQSYQILPRAIFEGEFRFDVWSKRIDSGEFSKLKLSILKKVEGGPRFLYTHFYFPGHSQNSGRCRNKEISKFGKRLIRANYEMRRDVAAAVKNHDDAIIVVAGDHGPYLTGNCTSMSSAEYEPHDIERLNIQDRFGAFLAIRWPTPNFEEYDEIRVLQDLFPVIFSYLLEDTDILNSRPIPEIVPHERKAIAGVNVRDGIILDGKEAGELLFESPDP